MKAAGKIRHIGLSEVGVEQIQAARKIAPIVSVQNLFNLVNRSAEPVLEYCEHEGIAFIPWFPIANRELANPSGPLGSLAAELAATPTQLALAWLLHRSPVMLPIPGTSSLAHLEENAAAAVLELSDAQASRLDALG
jgi:aryl-alcohol dehydrogenase-like predicted oxidoreductase